MSSNDEIRERLEDIERKGYYPFEDRKWLCSTVREQAQRIERLERVLAKVHPCMNRRRNECGDCLGEIEGAACPPDIWTAERVEAALRGEG